MEPRKNELLGQILDTIKNIYPIYKDVYVKEEEIFDIKDETIENYIIKITIYIGNFLKKSYYCL